MPRSPRSLPGLLSCWLLATAFAAEPAPPAPDPLPWSRADFVREAVLIPQKADPDPDQSRSLEYLAKQIKRPLTDSETALFQRTDSGPWRRHTDDLLAFDIPDDAALRIEALSSGDEPRLKVVGGRVGSTDNRFERAYRLTAGDGIPYLVILVSPQTVFDDGICLCGAIAYSKFLVRGDQRMRLDLLESGAVKRAQILGSARAILIEWTHTALTQSAYARIAASMRFVGAPSRQTLPSPDAKPGLGNLGWLERGMDAAAVQKLLGPPATTDETALVYEQSQREPDGDGWRLRFTLPLLDGRFEGFGPDWHSHVELPPLPGSIAWARRVLDPEAETKPTDAERRQVLDVFLEKAPQATGRSWNEWCQLASQLAEDGVKDPRVATLVARRFLEPELAADSHAAAWVLHRYATETRHDLFARAIRRLLEKPAEPGFFFSDLGNLLSFLDAKHPEFLELMETALRHPTASIRADALFRGEKLPPARARQAARSALDTETDPHALSMAGYLIRDVGVAEDIPWLETKRAETSLAPKLAEQLDEALEEIKKRAR